MTSLFSTFGDISSVSSDWYQTTTYFFWWYLVTIELPPSNVFEGWHLWLWAAEWTCCVPRCRCLGFPGIQWSLSFSFLKRDLDDLYILYYFVIYIIYLFYDIIYFMILYIYKYTLWYIYFLMIYIYIHITVYIYMGYKPLTKWHIQVGNFEG